MVYNQKVRYLPYTGEPTNGLAYVPSGAGRRRRQQFAFWHWG